MLKCSGVSYVGKLSCGEFDRQGRQEWMLPEKKQRPGRSLVVSEGAQSNSNYKNAGLAA